ncbi:MAG: hypothetical protein V1707_03835 [bacterium]
MNNQDNITKLFVVNTNYRYIHSWTRTVKAGVVAVIAIIFLSYLGWETVTAVKPPSITVESPLDNARTETGKITVNGTVEKGSFLTINDQKVFVDSDGSFSNQVFLSDGMNIITIMAKKKHSPPLVIKKQIVFHPVSAPTEPLTTNP